jgi:plastocyanin
MRVNLTIATALIAILSWSATAPGAETSHEQRRADGARVEIDDFAFHPRRLNVGRGTRVVFANRDGTAHTATRRGSFNTGRIRPGRSAALRFGRSGTYAYHCSIHPFMHGKIVVR